MRGYWTSWNDVPEGTVVLAPDGVPRSVVLNRPVDGSGFRIVELFGLPARHVHADGGVNVIELDDTDAIGNMLRTGLTLEII